MYASYADDMRSCGQPADDLLLDLVERDDRARLLLDHLQDAVPAAPGTGSETAPGASAKADLCELGDRSPRASVPRSPPAAAVAPCECARASSAKSSPARARARQGSRLLARRRVVPLHQDLLERHACGSRV